MSKAPEWFTKRLKAIDERLFVVKDGAYWILCMKVKGKGLAPMEVEHLGEIEGRQAFKLNDCSIEQRTLAFDDGTPIPLGSFVLDQIRESLWNYRKYRSIERARAEHERAIKAEEKPKAWLRDQLDQERRSIEWAKKPKVGVT